MLESGGYQILWGQAPLVSNMLFLLFYLIPPACIQFILTYESFSKDKWLNLLYWLSCINVVVVSVLQIAGISDFIESLIGAHVLLVLDYGGTPIPVCLAYTAQGSGAGYSADGGLSVLCRICLP